ncbi:hypothetical protein [Priestia taiwanensis]|uniref:Uncharacterized protein n=1 Tax=Priestia taiwanensis TaxID=1347902 RepID=A0A917EM40_9BACI|nr:hypothetical protein [Priestia taiwanensis]MBM7361609.1 FtsZ-binding cell division protein ZapB [Priestia taiwanensis]GGE55492.1 hypothetical protein GCM10007140_02320 [Priestia taiwanensis]
MGEKVKPKKNDNQAQMSIKELECKKNKLMKENQALSHTANILKKELMKTMKEREEELQQLLLLMKENDKLKRQYNALSKAKLGKFTLFYWKIKRKLKRKLKGER